MPCTSRRFTRRTLSVLAFAGSAALLASCTSSPEPTLGLTSVAAGTSPDTTDTNEYFSEAEYGVDASPRLVTAYNSTMPRGGGREMIGDPYMVKGKWYKPAEEPDYKKVGAASWYGDAFHGRLTANGEVYDMNRLSAAHPTMPLPSYARVTNLDNGSSVVVRVNDRGPFAKGRIIDLSKRAADLLDYRHNGVAKVEVDYLGRAPLDGKDDRYLLASYRPGEGMAPATGEEGNGVMLALDSEKSAPRRSRSGGGFFSSFADKLRKLADTSGSTQERSDPARPPADVASADDGSSALLGYAGERQSHASEAFAALSGETAAQENDYIAAGSFASMDEARALRGRLAPFGRADIVTEEGWHSVLLHANGSLPFDAMLRAAWTHGAPEAIVVRD